MSGVSARVGVGSRFTYDGGVVIIEELVGTQAGIEVLVCDGNGRRLRMPVRRLLDSQVARVIPETDGAGCEDDEATAAEVLGQLDASEREQILARAAHVREVLTGFRSGSAELAGEGEPRPQYAPGLALMARYEAKAAEIGVGLRTLRRWVAAFTAAGEAGLAAAHGTRSGSPLGRADDRWVQTALGVMADHTSESKPSRTLVIERTNARAAALYGEGEVRVPSRATAFRLLAELERRRPTFRLSTKRNRDIAARPKDAYGKLRPTRPGEYLLMDTNRLDVFALDPVTLRWVQAELSVSMDWYSRCVTGIRLTPVSTTSVDASITLYQAFRPAAASPGALAQGCWPEHGIPRAVLVDADAVDGPLRTAGPAIVPETIVIDHGKVYVSEHLTSVCQRLGVSIQPVRLRTGRDKGPLERFFRTLREDLLQALPGYKGPDVHSRGLAPENDAFFFLDELEAIIREWVSVYHARPHDSLVDPGLPGLRMSPAAMFEHGIARAGYIEVPRDPDLGFEFLPVQWRTIQHYGVEIGGRRYNSNAINDYRGITSSHKRMRGKWPFAVNPENVTQIFFRDPADRRWRALTWEHAPNAAMPLSQDALTFARRLAAAKYTFPNDRLAIADLLQRWNSGLGDSLAERRIALRISRSQPAIDLPLAEDPVTPAALKALSGSSEPSGENSDHLGDDDLDEMAAYGPDGDFYTDALEDV